MATVNNIVIDHPLRGIMVDKSNNYMWSINQITNPSLSVSLSDTAQAVDALGSVIAEFDRGRAAEFSAENSIWDLGLYAAQMGQDKAIASSTNKITAPAFETIDLTDATDYELAHTANTGSMSMLYILNGDGTLGEGFEQDTAAAATKYSYDSATNKITVPTDTTKFKSGVQVFIMYEYEMEEGVSITADSINFPKVGKFILECLGTDVCDPETLIHFYVIFPQAKLDGNVDYSFTTDGTHPFTIRAQISYCDKKKKLFDIIVPEEE